MWGRSLSHGIPLAWTLTAYLLIVAYCFSFPDQYIRILQVGFIANLRNERSHIIVEQVTINPTTVFIILH